MEKKINPRFASLKSFSDVIDTMIRGLKRGWVEVSMHTFGHTTNGICYGCAATNTLCELMQESFTPKEIALGGRVEKFNYDISRNNLKDFESAIDFLRMGDIRVCLYYLGLIEKILPFDLPGYGVYEGFLIGGIKLPSLSDFNWRDDIKHYEEYRDKLRENNL